MSNRPNQEITWPAAATIIAAMVMAAATTVALAVTPSSEPVTPCRAVGDEPPRGLTAKCLITEVYDGDTITVEVRVPVRVRLLDCWSPEVRTRDAEEKVLGIASRDYLSNLALGKEGTIAIPWEEAHRLDDTLTFGRVLAHVWVEGKSISKVMVEQGHATKEKK